VTARVILRDKLLVDGAEFSTVEKLSTEFVVALILNNENPVTLLKFALPIIIQLPIGNVIE